MDDLATELEDRGDRVRFAIATADPVAGECLAHMGYLPAGPGRYATRWFTPDARRLYDRFAASIGPMVRQCARLEPAPWQDALLEALRRLCGAGFGWWLYGTAALAVRGIAVAPGDVDLHVDDPFAAGLLFDDVLVTPVERLDGWAAAYVGRAFDGAVVEWLAAPHAALDDPDDPQEQGPFVADRIETVRWRGVDIPVPPLSAQLRSCERRGLTERAALVRAAMRDD
jgi:hypothetical protein